MALYDFGDKVTETLAEYLPEGERRTKRRSISERGAGDRSQMDAETLAKSAARARRKMRHKVLMMRADRLLTLTKRGGFDTQDNLWRAFDKFRRLVSKYFPDFQAIAVPELHTGSHQGGSGRNLGTYHLHLAIRGYHDAGLLRRLWYKALGGTGKERGADTPGNIDITSPKKGFWDRRKIAGYLSKYMAKELEGGQGQMNRKRYSSVGKIAEPAKHVFYVPVGDDTRSRVQKVVEHVVGNNSGRFWDISEGGRILFGFSTGFG